ncbi:MAG: hypothetical protein J6U01_10275 [Clostridia bacterium]|nr:hypothetical protein [Clostridia bacterium]
MSFVWVIIGAALVLGLLSGGSKGSRRKPENRDPVRIDHPHVIEDTDYECSACHKRFRGNTMTCPYCGARFTGRTEDTEEWEEEEDELEAWDEEDG